VNLHHILALLIRIMNVKILHAISKCSFEDVILVPNLKKLHVYTTNFLKHPHDGSLLDTSIISENIWELESVRYRTHDH